MSTQGLVPAEHFSGQAHVSPETKPDLATIIRALQNDLVKVLGIKGVQEITTADAVAIAGADATDEATSITLANEDKATYNQVVALFNDVKGKLAPVQEVDITSPDAEIEASIDASDAASSYTLLNSMKAKYNAAIALGNEMKAKLNSEGTITIAAADLTVAGVGDATDEPTAVALANALKTKVNEAVLMANEFKTDLNAAPKTVLESRMLF